MDKIKKFLTNHTEDLLIFAGLFLIALATFMINLIAGIYATGLILLILGLFLAKNPLKRG